MDKEVRIIYNKFENIKFNNRGYIDLNQSIIKGKNDLANICKIFRDPRYETFRILYMKNNKIVGQEALTSKIPNAVLVFDKEKNTHIRTYKKMINRMQRLEADGYYLAHNHPTESSKPSKYDIELTRSFMKNVEGFLGHIVLGSSDRYTIIGKGGNGLILEQEEKCISDSVLYKMEEELKNKTLYDIKISSRDELIALLKNIQNGNEYSIAVLTDNRAGIRMVLDIPNKMFNQKLENLNGFFKNIARECGATRVFIGTHSQKTYFKVIEHQKYGTVKDAVYIDNINKQFITEGTIKSPDLFDKERMKKRHRNRDVR